MSHPDSEPDQRPDRYGADYAADPTRATEPAPRPPAEEPQRKRYRRAPNGGDTEPAQQTAATSPVYPAYAGDATPSHGHITGTLSRESTQPVPAMADPRLSDSPTMSAPQLAGPGVPASTLPDTEPGSPKRKPDGTGRGVVRRWGAWLLAFLAFFLLTSAWSLATPLFGSPDEPSHVFRAAAVVRGEILPSDTEGSEGAFGRVHVPSSYYDTVRIGGTSGETDTPGHTPCFAHDVTVTADCQVVAEADDTLVAAGSGAARYNPVYYALVGWPSLIWSSTVGLFAMRIMSAAICSALLASALLSAAWGRGGRLVVAGVLAAATPAVIFLGGVVNPNALEICAAISLWVAGLRLVTDPGRQTGTLLRRVGIAGSLMVLTRSLSPFWLVAIVLTCVLLARKDALVPVLKRWDTWLWAPLLAVCAAAGAAWTLYSGAAEIPVKRPSELSYLGAVGAELRQIGNRLVQSIGFFGWNDTPSPPLAIAAAALLIGALVVTALALARLRDSIVLFVLLIVSVFGGFFIEATQYNKLGLFWQSRYGMPVTVGVVLVAAVVLAMRATRAGSPSVVDSRRLSVVAAFLFVAAQVPSFLHVLIRYQTGLHGGLNPLVGEWHPEAGSAVVVGVMAAGTLAIAVTVIVLRPGEIREPEPQAPADDPATDEPDGTPEEPWYVDRLDPIPSYAEAPAGRPQQP